MLMSKNDINDVSGVLGRVWARLDVVEFLMLDEDVDGKMFGDEDFGKDD